MSANGAAVGGRGVNGGRGDEDAGNGNGPSPTPAGDGNASTSNEFIITSGRVDPAYASASPGQGHLFQCPSTSHAGAGAGCGDDDEPPPTKIAKQSGPIILMAIPGHPEEVKLLMQDFRLNYLTGEILKIVLDSECLPKKDCLNCRLVSQQWNRSVLEHLQQHPSHLELDSCGKMIGLRYYQIKEPWQGSLQRGLLTPENSLRTLERLTQAGGNIFPSRKIFITDGKIPITVEGSNGQRNIDVWVDQVESILDRFGGSIWHCNLEFSLEVMDPVIRYYCLMPWLYRMPNLRSLRLTYRNHPTSTGWKEYKHHLVPRIKGKPMRELKHLTFLSAVDVPHPVFNEIVSKIPKDNLRKIRIQETANWLRTEDCKIIDMNKYDLELGSNVTEASIKLRQHDYAKLESMETLWPLRKLYLHLDFGWSAKNNCPRATSWSRIFRFLGAKFSSLTHLGLILPGGCGKDKDGKTWLLRPSLKHRLNLPHLKELRIELINISTLEFLRPMKGSLEVLFLHFSCIDYSSVDPVDIRVAMVKQLIKLDPMKVFKGHPTGPYEDAAGCLPSSDKFDAYHPLKSNIWKEFPKLRRMTIQFSSCFWMEGGVRRHLSGSPEPFKRVYVRGSQGQILSLDVEET